MAGVLRANYGFEAGIGNNRIFSIYKDGNSSGVQINGDIRIGGNNFYLGDEKVLAYDHLTATTYIHGTYLDTGNASIHSNGEIIFGSKQSGVYISPSTVLVGSYPVYHSGNANQAAIRLEDEERNDIRKFTSYRLYYPQRNATFTSRSRIRCRWTYHFVY